MTPQQKIKYAIMKLDSEWTEKPLPEVTKDNINDLYDQLVENDEHWEAMEEIRSSGVITNLPPRSISYNYEPEEVAIKTSDGSYIAFTYWSGGRKHGDPSEVPWMEDAYEVQCSEKVQTVIVQKFSK